MSALDLIPLEFRGQADGAIPNGRRIVKLWAEPGDFNAIGALGVVLSSMRIPDEALAELEKQLGEKPDLYMYFVEWHALPGVPVAVRGGKIEDIE